MLLLRHSSCEDDLRKRIQQGQTRIAAPTWSHFVISSSCFDGFKGKKGLAFIELSRHFKQSDALALLCNSSALSKCQSIPRSDAACSGPLRKSTQTGTTAPISQRYVSCHNFMRRYAKQHVSLNSLYHRCLSSVCIKSELSAPPMPPANHFSTQMWHGHFEPPALDPKFSSGVGELCNSIGDG